MSPVKPVVRNHRELQALSLINRQLILPTLSNQTGLPDKQQHVVFLHCCSWISGKKKQLCKKSINFQYLKKKKNYVKM